MPKRQIYITDIIIEVAIPVLVIGLIWTLVSFAISIRSVFYPGQETTLMWVFFCYVMGTVMVNRIAGYYGESSKAAVYSIMLAGVMALFAITFSGRSGSMVGEPIAGGGALANLIMVAVVGFASYKLARESCFDLKDTEKEKSAVQLRSELRAQRDWYRMEEMEEERARKELEEEKKAAEEKASEPAGVPKKHPGIWIIYFSLFSMVVFAVGQRFLPENDFEYYAGAFTYLSANLICALALLLLISLSALRAQCWEKKAAVPPGVGWFWILAGAALIIAVVSLATLPPRPVPEYLVRTIAEEDVSSGPYEEGEEGMKAGSNKTWARQTKLIEMKLAKQERDKARLKEEFENSGKDEEHKDGESVEKGTNSGEGSGGDEREAGKSERGDSGSGKGGSGKGSQRASSQKRTVSRSKAARAPMPKPPMQGLKTLGKVLFIIILACAALWGFVMLMGALGRANPLKKITGLFQNLRARLGNLFKKPKRARLSRKNLRVALEEQDLLMENPFQDRALLGRMSTAELVSYTYMAFENYSHAQGHTPSEDQTPIEFLKSLPEELRATEFSALVKLFMLAEYSPHGIPDKNVKKLKQVWKKIGA